MGSAPASGAADDALVVGIAVRGCGSKQYARHTKVRREGAPNSSRGCCAPPPFSLFAPCSNGLGSAPAPGAADDALVVGIPVRGCGSKQYARHTKVRRESAPNSSRDGCGAGQAPLRHGTLLTWENSPALARRWNSSIASWVRYCRPATLTVLSQPFFRQRQAVHCVTPTCSSHLERLTTAAPFG